MFKSILRKTGVTLLDVAADVQAPLVVRYVDFLERKLPDRDLEHLLEQQYLWTVTASGVAVGVSAAVPGIGTAVGIVAGLAETAFFLDASAVHALAVAAIHDRTPIGGKERRDLVLAVVLGNAGPDALGKHTRDAAKNWTGAVAENVPVLRDLNDNFVGRYVVQFVVTRAALLFGSALPAGIGAVVGALGNRALAREVITRARDAVAPLPQAVDATDSLSALTKAPTPGGSGGSP